MSNFTGECRKESMRLQGRSVQCVFRTDDYDLFAEHCKVEHQIKSWEQHQTIERLQPAPKWMKDRNKPFKVRYSKKPWAPKRFDVGDVVTFVKILTVTGARGNYDPDIVLVRGQVWANHPRPRTRWVVSDQVAYDVSEHQLVDEWLKNMRHQHYRACRYPEWYRRAPGAWKENARQIRLQIRCVEQQLRELES